AADRFQRVRERRVSAAPARQAAGGIAARHRADEVAGGGSARRRAVDAGRAFGRHGAARGAGACDRVRSDADPVRRAFRGPGSHCAEPGVALDQDAQQDARHHLDPGCARTRRDPAGGRSRVPDRERQAGRAGRAGRTRAPGFAVDAPVLRRRSGWPGALPLSGAGLRDRIGFCGAAQVNANLRRNWLLQGIASVGDCGLFFVAVLGSLPKSLRYWRETCRQVWFVGAMSLVIVMTCGLFIGMVLALQLYYTLSIFGGTSALGTVIALSLFRELGTVVTALLVAGRAGTAVTAEIGLMRATDQLDAMSM